MSKLYEMANEPERGMLVYIPTECIDPHPDNPRKDLGDLTELAESILQNGILQNLTVLPGEEPGRYTALIGHRRLAAAKLAGLTEVPCVVAEMEYREQIGTMFSENVQRADLTPYEQAECLQMMIDLGASQTDVANQTGLSEATVSRRLRLLKLDKKKFDKAQERGGASMEQYIKIAEIKSSSSRKDLLDVVGTDNFNARYQRAVKEQTIKELTPKIIKEVSAFAKEAPKGVDDWTRGYVSEARCDIEKWKPGALVIKKPKKDAQYFYYLTSYGTAYILRKEENTAPESRKLSEKEKAARRRRRELRTITEEMYQLRRGFVMSFSAGLKNKDVLLEWVLATLVGKNGAGLYHSFEKVPLQEKIGQDPKQTYGIDKDLLKTYWETDQGSAMVLIAYCNSGDQADSGYVTEGRGETMPYHNGNRDLDVLYEYLGRLGYRMSDEEKQLQDGTHPLFKKEDA